MVLSISHRFGSFFMLYCPFSNHSDIFLVYVPKCCQFLKLYYSKFDKQSLASFIVGHWIYFTQAIVSIQVIQSFVLNFYFLLQVCLFSSKNDYHLGNQIAILLTYLDPKFQYYHFLKKFLSVRMILLLYFFTSFA